MLTVNRLAPVVCRGTRTAVPVYTSNAACAFATAPPKSTASAAWLQKDKLKQKLKSISDEHNTRQQRLDYAEKILPYYLHLLKVLFPNEPDPTKPSKAAVDALVQSSISAPNDGAVAIPKWRELVAKQEKEWSEEDARATAEQKKEHTAHH